MFFQLLDHQEGEGSGDIPLNHYEKKPFYHDLKEIPEPPESQENVENQLCYVMFWSISTNRK